MPPGDFHIPCFSTAVLPCARPSARLSLSAMAQPDCPVCGGTGWRLVERVDGNQPAERVVERKNATHGPSSATPRFTWAVPCDCTGGDRVSRSLVRARIPHRYEHCDFENFDT